MSQLSPLDEACQLTFRILIPRYLSPEGEPVRTFEGACVVIERIGNRYGVPRDAVSYLYEIEHPELGFAFTARAVWRCGDLMAPLAVHTTILDFEDRGGHGSEHAVKLAANEWLRSLPL